MILGQHHLPGTWEKYNNVQSIIPVMKDGMKTVTTERWGGVWNAAKRHSDEGAGIQRFEIRRIS